MANDKPCLHLPLDEIRIAGETATARNVDGVGGHALVRGNPKVLHDPTMGTCMRFDGEDDFIELTDMRFDGEDDFIKLSAATLTAGLTVMAWVRFEDTLYFSRIFDLDVAQSQASNNRKSKIVWAGNEERSRHLALEIDGIRFRLDDGVALRQWRHYAFVCEPAGKVSIIIDGQVAFSKEAAFDVADTACQMGYVGKSADSFAYDSLFRGAMAHFRLYNNALAPAEVGDLMTSDRNAMAHYRETTLLRVDLYTIRDDDHKPILYVEAENKGEPLVVSLANPTSGPVAFKPFDTPTADDFHVQLRFRRNVIAPNVLRALQADNGVEIDGWQHAAGTTADGREDYISFLKTEASLALGKGEAWRIQIPDFSAAAQGGARNTRIQVRYRTQPQDPGSVVRHMEVQSHLGLKTIPLIARCRGSNTLLNNGTTTNELTVEVVYTNDTGSVRLADDSKFELIVDDDLRSVMSDGVVTSVSRLAAVSRVDWLEAQPAATGVGHEAIAFEVKRPENEQPDVEPASLMEVTRDQPLVFELSNWVTNQPSGTYNLLLRHLNIPGYWDGAWVLPVQFSPLLLRSDKIGIGTDEPNADLEIRKDVKSRVGPNLRLTNAEDGQNTSGAIDFNVGPHGQGAAHEPTFRIEGRNDAGNRTDLVFVGKSAPDKDSALEEKARITAEGRLGIGIDDPRAELHVNGRIQDRAGELMPVGAIVAYGGSSLPEGWLKCDGSAIPATYTELQQRVGSHTPDLQDRFILGKGPYTQSQGGNSSISLDSDQLPKHSHGVTDPGHTHPASHYFRESSTDIDDSSLPIYARNSNEAHPQITDLVDDATTGITIQDTGEGKEINIMPPYYALIYIIKG